jgi:DNA-binding CsgD family transcriptional regulator
VTRADVSVSAGGDLLSIRERQVLELAAQGLTNGEVGALLNISVHAVKFHLAAIYRKLAVSNRTEAAVLWRTQPPKDVA